MTDPSPAPGPHRVVIAGGGVAGLEALVALRALATERVALTLVAPDEDFTIRALSVQDPFAVGGPPRHYALAEVCEDHSAAFVRDAVARVDVERSVVQGAGGRELPYDSLLVAVGARPAPVWRGVPTFRGLQDAETVHGLVQDVEGGYTKRVAFVVPAGTTWPLPLYELALMLAERAYEVGQDDVRIAIVTPEDAPLGVFGSAASEAVAQALGDARVEVRTGVTVRAVEGRTIVGAPGDLRLEADRIVALPRLHGPDLPGLWNDRDGFLPVDEEGRARGTANVFGAGDGTTVPIKQGGVAAQQADAVAVTIARRAGADVPAVRFRPVLRGKLLTGRRARYLRQAVAGGGGEAASTASEHALWWPPSKVAAPYLAPYLERRDAGLRGPAEAPGAHALRREGDPAGSIEVLG
jgi:sulfide:quinone oxidoreductase